MNIGSSTGSCAATCIHSLGTHSNPQEAMIAFCQMQLGTSSYDQMLYPNYIFIAGPEDPGFGHSSRSWGRYGTEFAEFIVANGLGGIGTGGQVENKKFHAGCKCQAWVWTPDQDAVKAWWKKNQPPVVKKGFV